MSSLTTYDRSINFTSDEINTVNGQAIIYFIIVRSARNKIIPLFNIYNIIYAK
jgi:hypothetical protein